MKGQTEEAQGDKGRYDAVECKVISVQAMLCAIEQAKSLEEKSRNEEEKEMYQDVVRKLVENLNKQL